MNPLATVQKKFYVRPEMQPLGDIATLTMGTNGTLTLDQSRPSMESGGGNEM